MIRTVALAALSSLLASGQNASHEPLRDFLPEQVRIWTSPARVTRKQLPWLVLFSAGTAALIATDARSSGGLPNSPGQLRWGTRVSRVGGAPGVLAISGGLMIAGAAAKNSRLKRTGFAAGEAAAHAFLVTYALKMMTGRERPGTGSGTGQFWDAYGHALKGDTSFPSGHAMASWAVASAIAHQYPGNRKLSWLAYGYAAGVSAARVGARKHYLSDVLVGGAGGFLIGRMVSGRYSQVKSKPLVPQVVPMISPSRREAAAGLVWSWGQGSAALQ